MRVEEENVKVIYSRVPRRVSRAKEEYIESFPQWCVSAVVISISQKEEDSHDEKSNQNATIYHFRHHHARHIKTKMAFALRSSALVGTSVPTASTNSRGTFLIRIAPE